SRRFPDSPLVVSQNRNSLSRQKICNHQKWPVPREEFVTILRPGTRNQKHRGKRPSPLGNGQSPRKFRFPVPPRKAYFFLFVWKWLSRILRTPQFQHFLRPLELQIHTVLILRPLPRNRISRRV